MDGHHLIEVWTEPEQWERIREIVEAQDSSLPAKGHAVIFVELDGEEVISYQILHLNAIWLEGLWAKDGRAHLRNLWRTVEKWLRERITTGTDVLTMVRKDESGSRIGEIAMKAMKCDELKVNVYRRHF